MLYGNRGIKNRSGKRINCLAGRARRRVSAVSATTEKSCNRPVCARRNGSCCRPAAPLPRPAARTDGRLQRLPGRRRTYDTRRRATIAAAPVDEIRRRIVGRSQDSRRRRWRRVAQSDSRDSGDDSGACKRACGYLVSHDERQGLPLRHPASRDPVVHL